jgi:membrane associated rhomboid family serine protease
VSLDQAQPIAAPPSRPADLLRALGRRIYRLRITPIYAAAVVTIWAGTFAWAPALRARLVHHNSTNVANLLHGRVYTLLTSAFVLGSRWEVLAVVGLVVVLGAAESAFGWVRAAGVFLFGHVVATLLVFAGLATGIALHWWGGRTAHAADVGVSYGAVAVVGALLVYLPLRRAVGWRLVAVALAIGAVVANHTFSDAGHLISLLLGFAAGAVLRRAARRQRGSGQQQVDVAELVPQVTTGGGLGVAGVEQAPTRDRLEHVQV